MAEKELVRVSTQAGAATWTRTYQVWDKREQERCDAAGGTCVKDAYLLVQGEEGFATRILGVRYVGAQIFVNDMTKTVMTNLISQGSRAGWHAASANLQIPGDCSEPEEAVCNDGGLKLERCRAVNIRAIEDADIYKPWLECTPDAYQNWQLDTNLVSSVEFVKVAVEQGPANTTSTRTPVQSASSNKRY